MSSAYGSLKRIRIEMDSDAEMDDGTEAVNSVNNLNINTPDDRETQYPADYPAETFLVLANRSEILAQCELKRRRSRLELRNNQGDRDKLKKKLARLDAISESISETIASYSCAISDLRNELIDLRFLGPTLTVSDLPEELVVAVLMYAGFEHQQRLVRVCSHWKWLITGVLDHVYMDYKIFESKKNSGKNNALIDHIRETWKDRCRPVRSITLNGRFIAEVGRHEAFKPKYFLSFPSLARLNLVHVLVSPYASARNIVEEIWCDPGLSFRLFLIQSYIQAFSRDFLANCLQRILVRQRFRLSNRLNGHKRVPFYKRIPDMEITDDSWKWGKEARFSDGDMAWLKTYAAELNFDLVKSVLKGAKSASGRDNYMEYHEIELPPKKFCNEHMRQCRHLSVTFYTDELDEDMQNFLLLLICCLRIPSPSSRREISGNFFQVNKRAGHCQQMGRWAGPGDANFTLRKRKRKHWR